MTSDLSYTAVDRCDDPNLCVRLLDMMRSVDGVQGYRLEALETLNLQPGQGVLDLGCGMGDLSRDLARYVAPGGAVTGVDFSEAMVAEALRRQGSSRLPVMFEQGDAAHLRFDSGSFDACWTERMLCHVPDVGTVLSEIARVLRPGGQVLIVDADTDATLIDHPDRRITSAFVTAMAGAAPNRSIGRQLRRRLTEAGLTRVILRPRAVELPYRMFEAMAAPLRPVLVSSGEISADEFDAWADDLAGADARGTFFMSINIFIAAGTKP